MSLPFSLWRPGELLPVRAMGGRYGDHRNWPAIQAWADIIAAQLLGAPSHDVEPVSG